MGVTYKNLAILLLSIVIAAFWIGNGQADGEVNFPMPRDKVYVEECGGCHTAYAPGLLPARSWQKMMNELEDHFGEDASLEEPQQLAVLRWLTDYAADASNATPLMRRIAASITRDAAPQRITETALFKYMHDEVPAYIWKRAKIGSPANCGACHTRANEGRYSEREVRIPK